MILRVLCIFFLFVTQVSCGQSNDKGNYFNESDYKEVRRGEESKSIYVITYLNKSDTNYKLKKRFPLDSTYKGGDFTKLFYFKDLGNGPYETYHGNKLAEKGYFKMGLQEGERIRYRNGILYSRSHFNKGKRTGEWFEYDKSGKAKRKMIYENDVLKSDVDL